MRILFGIQWGSTKTTMADGSVTVESIILELIQEKIKSLLHISSYIYMIVYLSR